MKTGPRYIGIVNHGAIAAHIEALGITALYKIKMHPVDFEKLVVEYRQLFQKDFNTVLQISGVSVEPFHATPVNRICVVNNNPGSEDSCAL